MKKIWCCILVCSLLFLSACGSQIASNETSSITSIKVGDKVRFGHYGNSEVGLDADMVTHVLAYKMGENPEWDVPIEWEVVYVDDEYVDLVSVKALWRDTIDKINTESIETYCRGEFCNFFYDFAFTEEEKNVMGYYYIDNYDESHDYNVLIPSIDEIRDWFGESSGRICYNFEDIPVDYWVRDKSVVQENGEIESLEYRQSTTAWVRPKICVLKNDFESYIYS